MCVVVHYADSWILLACAQMFQNLLDKVSSSSLMNRKQDAWPPPPYAPSLPPLVI